MSERFLNTGEGIWNFVKNGIEVSFPLMVEGDVRIEIPAFEWRFQIPVKDFEDLVTKSLGKNCFESPTFDQDLMNFVCESKTRVKLHFRKWEVKNG